MFLLLFFVFNMTIRAFMIEK